MDDSKEPNQLELKIDQIGILSVELNDDEYQQVYNLEQQITHLTSSAKADAGGSNIQDSSNINMSNNMTPTNGDDDNILTF